MSEDNGSHPQSDFPATEEFVSFTRNAAHSHCSSMSSQVEVTALPPPKMWQVTTVMCFEPSQ